MRKNKKRKKRLRAVLVLLIILFILAGLGGMLYVSHRDKVEKEQRREAALAALDSIPEVTAENYQGIWYSEDGLTTIDIYDISLKSVSFTYKRVNGKDPSMTAEVDVTAEVAGNATQFRFKDSEGNKAKGEFVFDKSGELYVKVKTYERGEGSLTYPKTESIMTRQEPSLEVSENSEEDASYNESNENSYEQESYSESSEDSSDENTEEYEIPYGEEETYYTE